MKSTGIVRKLDKLGRFVIPKELRNLLNLDTDAPMEYFVENDKIILKKYIPVHSCFITGDVKDSNVEYAPGLILSPKGVEILLNNLKK